MADLLASKLNILVVCGQDRILRESDLYENEAKLSDGQKSDVYIWLKKHSVLVLAESNREKKKALYYFEKGRRFRPTKQELQSCEFLCPKCRVTLRKTIYKLRTPLFGCPGCGWSIRRDDIWSPEPNEKPVVRGPGEATNWLD